jgi:hypothetical protein
MLKMNLTAAGSPLMELVKFATTLIRLGNWAADSFNNLPPWIKHAMGAGIGNGIPSLINNLLTEDPAKETAKNTREMKRILDGIYKEGLSGGGSRARGAIPGRWQGTDKLEGTNRIEDIRLGIL